MNTSHKRESIFTKRSHTGAGQHHLPQLLRVEQNTVRSNDSMLRLSVGDDTCQNNHRVEA